MKVNSKKIRRFLAKHHTKNPGIIIPRAFLFMRTTNQSPRLHETLATVAITRENRESCFHLLTSSKTSRSTVSCRISGSEISVFLKQQLRLVQDSFTAASALLLSAFPSVPSKFQERSPRPGQMSAHLRPAGITAVRGSRMRTEG